MNDYYSKYLKYKNKYIKLKELRGGIFLAPLEKINELEYNNSMMIH